MSKTSLLQHHHTLELHARHYTLIVRIAKSLYGAVYLVFHRPSQKRMAVKVSSLKKLRRTVYQRRTTLGDGVIVEDPLHEAALWSHLPKDQHVLDCIEHFESGDFHYLVTEYAASGELFQIVTSGAFNSDLCRKWLTQLLLGALHLHRVGVCHLDLSLENVLVTETMDAKICDFGVARRVDRGSKMPGNAVLLSKEGYMAPEVVNQSGFNPYAADVFSLGVTFYRLVARVSPFQRASPDDLGYKMIVEGRVNEWHDLLRFPLHFSLDFQDLLQGMLSPVERRYTLEQVAVHPFFKRFNE